MSCNRIKKILILGIVLLLLNSCRSQASFQNNVEHNADFFMISKIEQQYQQWSNTPYRYGGNSLKGIDCSGLVNDFYNHKLNISIPRVTIEQAKIGKTVSNLQAGDLIFFKTGRGQNGLHVGIYYKNGQFLHVSTSNGVKFSNINDDYWKTRYWQAKRIVI